MAAIPLALGHTGEATKWPRPTAESVGHIQKVDGMQSVATGAKMRRAHEPKVLSASRSWLGLGLGLGLGLKLELGSGLRLGLRLGLG